MKKSSIKNQPTNSEAGKKGSDGTVPGRPMALRFHESNGLADEVIERLMELVGGIHHRKIVREMILAALKAGQESAAKMDLKLMNSTLKEMRFTAKVFSPYRKTRKVTVFGSARVESHEPTYQMATRLGQALAKAGFMVITGGGPGIMQAVNEGAGPENSFGVNIRLPFEQKSNPVLDGNPRQINYKYFFNRKVAFLKESDAVVLLPGGFGTLDEAMETMTLVQTGKRNPLPIILLDVPGGTYWDAWLKVVEKELLAGGYIGSHDLSLLEHLDSVEKAVERIQRFYSRYHSLRFVGERLVIRLTSSITEKQAAQLKSAYADILSPGGDLCLSAPLPEEADEAGVMDLPRIVVDFNRKDFGRLQQLIHDINAG